MSNQPLELVKLQFDVSDRLRKAIQVAEVSNSEMAEYLGVSRNTVSRLINGFSEPRLATLRLWALRTGVPFEWLATGIITDNGGPDGPITLR